MSEPSLIRPACLSSPCVSVLSLPLSVALISIAVFQIMSLQSPQRNWKAQMHHSPQSMSSFPVSCKDDTAAGSAQLGAAALESVRRFIVAVVHCDTPFSMGIDLSSFTSYAVQADFFPRTVNPVLLCFLYRSVSVLLMLIRRFPS